MKKYNVTGMSCAACSARVEKAVGKVPGVTSCSVSLLTNSMGVEGSAGDEDIIKAVVDAGYGASVQSDGMKKGKVVEPQVSASATGALVRRLCWSIFFVCVLMYFSMGHMMWGWPVPAFFNGNPVAMGILQLLLSAVVMIINQKFFINGFKGVIHGSANMDTLVAMGSGVSFVWSVYVLFRMTGAQVQGDVESVQNFMKEFYFESAAMILALITVGKTLESYSKGKTTDALKSLMKLAPETAVVLRDGKEVSVNVDDVSSGEIFIVRPGQAIPCDGVVLEGFSAVNEAALTGESIPVEKTVSSKVTGGTLNTSGFLKCRSTSVGKDSALSKIIQMVSDASATKAPVARIADKVSGVFVPVVISIAVLVTVVWLLAGKDFAFALERGISVLVISCPCALGLATPVAIMVGNGVGARNGILFKTSESLEVAGKAKIVVLDKTGTVTEGRPVVTDVVCFEEGNGLLKYAKSLEAFSEHPVAKAVCAYEDVSCDVDCVKSSAVEDFEALPGNGVRGKIDGVVYYGGSRQFIEKKCSVPEKFSGTLEELAGQGKTLLLFCSEKEFLGVIAVADRIKPDAKEAVEELKKMKLKVYMLTGDNEKTARQIAGQCGIENVAANVLPGDKASVVNELKKQGKVIMVGDGINDAPALTCADVGFAIGTGTDVAVDSAQVVLMNEGLENVPAAIKLSRRTLTNIYENLFWAFIYNIVGIPLAAGAFINLTGWKLNPMFGAAAMSLSSFCVVSNALRLNLVKIKKQRSAGKNKSHALESEASDKEKNMTKTIRIEGMMCSHCEAHVKNALEAVDGVASAVASHEKGTAVVTLSKDVADEVLSKAVAAADYKVLGIE